jgi:hypothetical protein
MPTLRGPILPTPSPERGARPLENRVPTGESSVSHDQLGPNLQLGGRSKAALV